MEVRFTPEQEAQLAQIASSSGTDAEQWVRHNVLSLIKAEHQVVPLVPELPRWDLGAVDPLHRRDLYDDGI
jgi:hypothetical protein